MKDDYDVYTTISPSLEEYADFILKLVNSSEVLRECQ